MPAVPSRLTETTIEKDAMKKISEVIEQLRDIYDEYGDVGAEMYDAYDMEMRQPVTHVKFDQDRQRVQFLSDR
jgi:hypothetical protein